MDTETRETAPREPAALDELRDDPQSRKRFLKMVGGAGAAGALSLLIAACGGDDDDDSSSSTSTTDSIGGKPAASMGDLEIVNYALTLEYLEADFYAQVIASGEVTDKKIVELAKSIGRNEAGARRGAHGDREAAWRHAREEAEDEVRGRHRRRTADDPRDGRRRSRTSEPPPTSARRATSRTRRSSPPRSRSIRSRVATPRRSTRWWATRSSPTARSLSRRRWTRS